MELKLVVAGNYNKVINDINRTSMELKRGMMTHVQIKHLILIEPLWN